MSGAESGTLARPEAVAESARVADTCAVVVAGGLGLRFGDPKGKRVQPATMFFRNWSGCTAGRWRTSAE